MDGAKPGHKPKSLKVPMSRYQIPGSPVFVSISVDGGAGNEYRIIEPDLSPNLLQALSDLREYIRQTLKNNKADQQFAKNFLAYLHRIISEQHPDYSVEETTWLIYYLNRDTRGFGKIQPLVEDPLVSLISITGPEQTITLQHVDHGLLFSSLTLSATEITHLIKKLQNRSKSPISGRNSQSAFTLRSGLQITLSSDVGEFHLSSLPVTRLHNVKTSPLQLKGSPLHTQKQLKVQAGPPLLMPGGRQLLIFRQLRSPVSMLTTQSMIILLSLLNSKRRALIPMLG